jgi:large subunit GTPase 1
MALADANRRMQLTPFEKNLDVWRQLWRVVERSDVLVQVLHACPPSTLSTS